MGAAVVLGTEVDRLSPMGLGPYPLAVAWTWHRPTDR
jgi:hypothetical protein